MPLINFPRREINCKIVYYGPGLSGKTTNLEAIHEKAPEAKKGPLTSIATQGDRTLFFDYMPLNLGSVGGMSTKFQLYTVPGQPYYNATRKLVLRGADGVVFVADSRKGSIDDNLESFRNLEENLLLEGIDPEQIPIVLQWNKRDLVEVESVEDLNNAINKYDSPGIEASAVTGEGVFPTLKKIAQLVLEKLNQTYGLKDDEDRARNQVVRREQPRRREAVIRSARETTQDEPELERQPPRLPDFRRRQLPPREKEADGPQPLSSGVVGVKVVVAKLERSRLRSLLWVMPTVLLLLLVVALVGAAWGGYLSSLEELISSLK